LSGSTFHNPGRTWEHQRQAREHQPQALEHLGVLATSPGAATADLCVATINLGAHQITVEQFGKHIIIFGNAAGVPGNHSYYLSFNDF